MLRNSRLSLYSLAVFLLLALMLALVTACGDGSRRPTITTRKIGSRTLVCVSQPDAFSGVRYECRWA